MAELFSLADRLGARKVATGHYARIVWRSHRAELHRGSDRTKDQSYFLSGLSHEQLARLEFPLGSSTKTEVRADALARRLPGAGKGESQELCFVPRGRYDAFIEERAAGRLRPGPIVDADGQVVGQHAGVHRFTLGQRKKLGVALGAPAFVAALDAASATVRLGRGAELQHRGARLRDSTFFDDVRLPVRAEVQVRYRQQAVPAIIDLDERGVRVQFDEPVRSVAHGQALVAYRGERVLGGGTIDSAMGDAS
jgi:tRNA-specific 2-thiouridylase